MPRVSRQVIDAVRDATDIVELVSKYVKLGRGRRDYKGLCPFHQEKTPSFHVVPDKGIYHCFGCNAGGDAFRFLAQMEGLTFIEAVKELAVNAGITIEERELTPAERQAIRQRATAFDMMDDAASFFSSTLWTRDAGAPGRAYLQQRALDPELMKTAGLGFAPDAWSSLLDHMVQQGYSPDQLAAVGLVKPRERGDGHYDTFRNRVLFPIRDERGRIIAFGGRLLSGEGPKYLNTPETQLYQKSQVLYGLDMARHEVGRKDRIIVVEGYFDVLAMHQAGFQETVATCGTALTADHLAKIRRLTTNVVLLLDADEAGTRAAVRSLPQLVEAGLAASRLQLPDAKDPDELLREQGPEAVARALEHTQPLIEWVVEHQLAHVADPVARENLIENLVPVLARLPGNLLSRVARAVNIPEQQLLDRVRSARPADRHSERDRNDDDAFVPPGAQAWRANRELVHVLWLIVHCYDQVADVLTHADPMLLDDYKPVQMTIARLLSGEPVANVLGDLDDAQVARTVSAVVARERLYTREEARLAICQILERLGRPRRDARLAQLTARIGHAHRENDTAELRGVLQAQAAVRGRIRKLEQALRAGDTATYVRVLDEEAHENAGEPVNNA